MLLVVWEILSAKSVMVRILVSSPFQVARYFVGHINELLLDAGVTSVESFAGLIMGACVACVAMLLASRRPSSLRWIITSAQTTQALPLISLAPFFIVAFGLGIASKVAMTILVSFFPLLMGLAGASRSLPQDWDDYVRFRGTNPDRRFWFVAARLRLPDLLRSTRIAASLSVVGAIVAEFNGASYGLGRNLFIAAKRLEPELMVASISSAVCLSLFYYSALGLVDRIVNRWYWDSVSRQEEAQ